MINDQGTAPLFKYIDNSYLFIFGIESIASENTDNKMIVIALDDWGLRIHPIPLPILEPNTKKKHPAIVLNARMNALL